MQAKRLHVVMNGAMLRFYAQHMIVSKRFAAFNHVGQSISTRRCENTLLEILPTEAIFSTLWDQNEQTSVLGIVGRERVVLFV